MIRSEDPGIESGEVLSCLFGLKTQTVGDDLLYIDRLLKRLELHERQFLLCGSDQKRNPSAFAGIRSGYRVVGDKFSVYCKPERCRTETAGSYEVFLKADELTEWNCFQILRAAES